MKIELNNEKLDSIDLSRYEKYDLDIGNKYFYLKSGREHYRLLAYLSSLFSNQTFFDVGTNHGCSALALAYNPLNKVVSVDLRNNRKEKFEQEKNIQFKLGKGLHSYRGFRPKIFFLDADKSDDFEENLINQIVIPSLIMSGGLLIMDDYHEYPVVRKCIEKLAKNFPVYDLTKYGHYSGTHLVDIGLNLEIEQN